MQMKVLLVDDQAYSFSELKEQLSDLGYDLVRRTDASEGLIEALELNRTNTLRLIILDIIMKAGREFDNVTDGREAGVVLAERLRQEGVKAPIMYYTVVSDDEIKERAIRVTRSRYIGKIAADSIARIAAKELKKEM